MALQGEGGQPRQFSRVRRFLDAKRIPKSIYRGTNFNNSGAFLKKIILIA